MSEDTQEVQEAPEGDVQEESGNPIEAEARKMGWRPQDEYDGDNWVNAEIFVARAPLIEKIEGMGKALKRVNSETEQIKEHYKKVKETAYQQALKDLRAERRAAIQEGDADTLDAVDEQLDKLKEERIREEQEQQTSASSQTAEQVEAFQTWRQRNNWYQDHAEATELADTLGRGYHSEGATPDQVLAKVEKAIRKAFPELYRNPNRDKPSGTVTGSSTKMADNKQTKQEQSLAGVKKSLTDEQRQVMNKLVRSGMLTEEEYLRDFKAISEADNG
jgi:hypothetical protein